MKKCPNCGKAIEDKYDMCYACSAMERARAESPKDRQSSIERQVAAKCVAQVYEGRIGTEAEIVKAFSLFLRLIRGE